MNEELQHKPILLVGPRGKGESAELLQLCTESCRNAECRMGVLLAGSISNDACDMGLWAAEAMHSCIDALDSSHCCTLLQYFLGAALLGDEHAIFSLQG